MSLRAMLLKEALLHWRGRGQLVSTAAFGAITLLLFSFAVGPNSQLLRQHSAGFLWLAILLGSTLSLGESLRVETEHRALEGTLLLGVGERAIFYAKALALTVQLTFLGWILIPVMVVLYDAGTMKVPGLMLTVAAGAAGIAAPGTLYAAMAAGTRDRQVLLPLLLFPLLVPLLLSSVRVTSLLILGDPMEQLSSWLTLLLAFDAIYWSLCGLLFGKVLEE